MATDWQRVRKVVYARDGGVCMKCGKRLWEGKPFHVDHIIPISKGGEEWDLSNLELACPECNLKKGAKLEQETPEAVAQPEEAMLPFMTEHRAG